jgi:leader peptidase (prepilin peptidase)/N-methyltransferase
VNFRQRFDHPDGGTVVTRPGERIARGRGESRRVTLRAVGVAVWVALAVACALVFEDTVEAVVNAVGCAVLVAVSITDLERRIIPNRIIVPALAAALVVQTARDPSAEWLLGALAAGGFFLVLALVYPAGLGMGDVKLAAFLGAWLGWDAFVGLFVGTLLGMLPALVILVRRGAAGRRTTLPYVPALAAGAVIGVFFGDAILDAWLG